MTQSLIIKDGTGATKTLTVESSSYGYIPVHSITSSNTSPVYITGTITVNTGSSTVSISNTSLNVTSAFVPVTTVSQTSVTSFDWSTSASGTFQIAAADTNRKGLMVFNPGPENLYVVLSTAGGTKNGFVLVDTASAPTGYSLIVYPSGTYIADQTNVSVTYGGYFISGSTAFISGSTTKSVLITTSS